MLHVSPTNSLLCIECLVEACVTSFGYQVHEMRNLSARYVLLLCRIRVNFCTLISRGIVKQLDQIEHDHAATGNCQRLSTYIRLASANVVKGGSKRARFNPFSALPSGLLSAAESVNWRPRRDRRKESLVKRKPRDNAHSSFSLLLSLFLGG